MITHTHQKKNMRNTKINNGKLKKKTKTTTYKQQKHTNTKHNNMTTKNTKYETQQQNKT